MTGVQSCALPIYDRHVPMVTELLQREPKQAPKVTLNPEIKNFYDFKVEDFEVENYEYGQSIGKIPVAI